jgi:hypothetical protein
MWLAIFRTVLATALLVGGIASLIYGGMHHTITVTEERKREITIPPPPMFGPMGGAPGQPPMAGGPGDPQFPGMPPMMVPPEFLNRKETIVEKISKQEPEPIIVREVTFGGVTRLASGELRRTYSGPPPQLCPT